jgi:hypothetical protein
MLQDRFFDCLLIRWCWVGLEEEVHGTIPFWAHNPLNQGIAVRTINTQQSTV